MPIRPICVALLAICLGLAPTRAVAADPPAAAAPDPSPGSSAGEDEPEGLNAKFGSVDAAFRFFGDTGAAYDDRREGRLSFLTGSFDAFTTVRIGDHFQVLSEIVAEFDGDTNEIGFEMERYWVKWSANDWFYAKLGREHDPVNRWNRRFHHGRIFWPAVSQPFLARFEDQGGPLPIHAVGLEMGGVWHARAGDLGYVAVLSNGRGIVPTEVANAHDHNNSKAWDVGVNFSPSAAPHLSFGANYRGDKIPADPALGAGLPDTSESIASVFFEDHVGRVQLLAEYAAIKHDTSAPGSKFDHRSWYVQANVRIGRTEPFARIDLRNMDRGDPYYVATDLDLDRRNGLLGVRVDLADRAAFKIEAGYGHGEFRDAGGIVTKDNFTFATAALQWMF